MADEAEDDEEIVSYLIPQEEEYNTDKSRNQKIKNSTVVIVLIYQTGYTSPTIVHSLAKVFPKKKDKYNKKRLGAI